MSRAISTLTGLKKISIITTGFVFGLWHSVGELVSALQRNRTNKMYRYREREIYFKELTHATVKVPQVQNLGEASRLETQKRVAVLVQRQSAGESGRSNIADDILRQSAGQTPPCLREVSLSFYSQVSGLETHSYYGEQSALLKVH